MLTVGAVQAFQNNEKVEKPILRISNMKRILAENGPEKIRLILTDGTLSHSFVMLNTQLNEKVDSGEIVQDSIIRLDSYFIKEQNNKNIVMIAALTVMKQSEIENTPPSNIPINIGTVPINLLNPYQNKWSIKGRVLHKDHVKTWSKPSSEGKLFSFTIADDTCDVRITAFNQEVDKFHDLIEVDKTYIISRGMVKVANRKFNSTKCDHEITLKSESEITEVSGANALPAIKYDFVDIVHIKERSADSSIDVVGVAHKINDVSTITVKSSNKEVSKRDIVLVDRSGGSINLTLWADDVKTVDNLEHPIIVVRSAIVKDFGGRSLSVSNNSVLRVNPTDVPEASPLIGWYQEGGRDTHFEAQSSGGSFRATKKALISELACTVDGDKGDYFTVKGVIANIKRDNLVYKSCGKCNKKLVDLNNGLYNCERCNIESQTFKYRLMININILDFTGGVWASAFQDTAEKLLGVSSDEIGRFIEEERKESIDKIISNVIYSNELNLKIRVNNDTYNDETRLKVTLVDVSTISVAEEMQSIMEELRI